MEINISNSLEGKYKYLNDALQEFNDTLFVSPHSAIIKGRTISENIIIEVSKLEEYGSLAFMTQAEKLRKLKFEGVLELDIYNRFQHIRLVGNKAAHSNIEGELESALNIHKNLFKVTCWFIESYIDYNFKSPSYKSPVPPEDRTIDIDTGMITDLLKKIVQEQVSDKEIKKIVKSELAGKDSSIDIGNNVAEQWNMNCIVQELSKLRESSKEAVEGLNEFSQFKKYIHIEREAQKRLQKLIFKANESEKAQLVLVSGSVGDGKSHIISYFKNKYPDIMDSFTLHNDATESLEPDKTSTDTLNQVLEEFSDEKIGQGNKKLILAINLGTLNNFIDSEYGKRFSILRKYVYDKKIIETTMDYNGFDEKSSFQFVNFSDYSIFTLKDEKVYSSYIEALISKITDPSELNCFYNSYKHNCIECDNRDFCPIKSNYELLSNKIVQKSIVDLLVQAIIKKKIIISTRALINFIYELIIPISYIDINSATIIKDISELDKLEYIGSLMPNILFNHKELSFIFEALHSLDPLDIRNQDVDNFIIEFNNSVDPVNYFKEYIDFPKNYMNKLYKLDSDKFENAKIRDELLKFFIRSYYIYGSEELFSLRDHVYEDYMKNIYFWNKGDKLKLKNLYDTVKNGILKWNGEADKDKINIFMGKNQMKYKISEDIELKPDVSNLPKNEEKELKKFSTILELQYKSQKSEEVYNINIDFLLYQLLVQINNGYRPNRKDKNQFINFIEFISKLEETGSQNEKLIFTEKNRKVNKQYKLEYDSDFEIYRFMETSI